MIKTILICLTLFLSVGVFAEKSISEMNPNFRDLMNQGLKPINTYPNEYRELPKPLSLFFFADVHADKTELERYCAFIEENKAYFDDAVCAGDQVLGSPTDDWDFWGQVKGAEKILFVMGNHDIWYQKRPSEDKKQLNEQEAYDKYYAPYVKNWNCVCEEGKAYFYKDYTDKKVRLIGINCMSEEAERKKEVEWFRGVLEDARVKGFSVVAMTHIPPVIFPVSIECNWCEFDRDEGNATYATDYLKAVKEFKKKGGDFVVWLAGHTHSDYLLVSKEFPDQLIMVVGETHRGGGAVYSQLTRTDGTQSQDLANALIIDTSSKTLKALRLGSHYDRYFRPINALSINYSTLKIITQW